MRAHVQPTTYGADGFVSVWEARIFDCEDDPTLSFVRQVPYCGVCVLRRESDTDVVAELLHGNIDAEAVRDMSRVMRSVGYTHYWNQRSGRSYKRMPWPAPTH